MNDLYKRKIFLFPYPLKTTEKWVIPLPYARVRSLYLAINYHSKVNFLCHHWNNAHAFVDMVVLSYHFRICICTAWDCAQPNMFAELKKRQNKISTIMSCIWIKIAYIIICSYACSQWVFTASSFVKWKLINAILGHLRHTETMQWTAPPHLNYCAIVCLSYIRERGIQYAHIRYPRKAK